MERCQTNTNDWSKNGSTVVVSLFGPEQSRSHEEKDDDDSHADGGGDATWDEVYTACCVHTPVDWGWIILEISLCCFFLFFFLLGLDLLGHGAKVMSGCRAGALLGDDTNPIAGLMVGIVATVFMQSSSTTTSIVVSLVGADAISVQSGIYIIMGANMGTSVANTIVAMGQIRDADALERAFAGATVPDMCNMLNVAVLFPVEVATHYLFHLTRYVVQSGANTKEGDGWVGPVKRMVGPLSAKVIQSNANIIKDVAEGISTCEEGGGYYPVVCVDPDNPTYDTCDTGLVACDKGSGKCPIFFQATATAADDKASGAVVFLLGIIFIFICLLGLVSTLRKMLLGTSTRIIYKATDLNGYTAMMISAGLTVLVQSASITTSFLTSLVAMRALPLEQMLPLSLGANIGKTVTALLASLVTEGTNALQVALAHLFFNLTGVLILYPLPVMRKIPLLASRYLGRSTRMWRIFPIFYVMFVYVLLPLFFLSISYLFEQDSHGCSVLGAAAVCFVVLALASIKYYCLYRGGQQKCVQYIDRRDGLRIKQEFLAEDLDHIQNRVSALLKSTADIPYPDIEQPTSLVQNCSTAQASVVKDLEHIKNRLAASLKHAELPGPDDEQPTSSMQSYYLTTARNGKMRPVYRLQMREEDMATVEL